MNINKRKNKFIAAFFIYIIGFLWLLVVSSMLQTTEEALKLFNTCIIAYLIIGACILAHIVSNGGDVFEPLTVITILYALLCISWLCTRKDILFAWKADFFIHSVNVCTKAYMESKA